MFRCIKTDDNGSRKQPYWFIDGVSCLGKTHFIMTQRKAVTQETETDNTAETKYIGLPLDYAERVKRNSFFAEKHVLHTTQIMYTASFCCKFFETLQGLTNNQILFVDRSPISDLWYEILFKFYNDDAVYEKVFDQVETLKMFDYLPTIFVIPDSIHAPAIRDQMAKRQNGIDQMATEYVIKQIHVFNRVAERFGAHENVRVIRIDATMPIFTTQYFEWLRNEFLKCTE